MELPKFIDMHKVCRICLVEKPLMMCIFSEMSISEALENRVSSIAAKLYKLTSISVNNADGFPRNICTDCINLVNSAYNFQLQFAKSHDILKQYAANRKLKSSERSFPEISSDADDFNAADNFIESAKNVQIITGKRQTSRKQIEKRSIIKKKTSIKRRGNRPKMKTESDESNDDDEDEKVNLRLHPCPICTEEFTALELRKHAHTHKALKKYLSIPPSERIKASTRFFRKYDPEKETINIHNRDVKLHRCVLCGDEFTALDLQMHLEDHRNQNEFKCDQCERVFKKMNHLNTHRVKHLKEFPFKCEHCSKGFVIKKNYDCHVLTHNTNQELPHECKHCFRRFSNPEHLNRHIIIHTENVSYSVKYRVCKCHHCLKTFKDRDELKRHNCVPIKQTIHSRYPCKLCSKVFKNSSALYNHNRNIHKLKGAKVLCSVCGNYVSNIYNHMMRHTGEKPFQCNQCGKRFLGKPQLKQHLLVHSGLKPYVCSVCAKAFNNLYNLQVHERIHKGDRCHICNICNKGFLEKSYLKKHMNVHTKI